MLWLHIVKRAGKNEFREEQFIACGNFTCHAAFLFDDIFGWGEAESAKNAFAALELIELQHIVSRGDL